MAKIRFQDGTVVSDYGYPYIIAEVNSSHNGDIEVAKKMIDAAVDAGCNCVKFQSWSSKSLYSKTYYQKNPIAKRFVDKLSLSPEQLKEMSLYCKSKGIGFSSTPYSIEEVDFLVNECEVPFVKISSMEINNKMYLRYIGEKGIPIVLSTGMADESEIDEAIRILEETGNRNIAILHCVSIYPADAEKINLKNIEGFRSKFPNYPIGFSDHTIGDEAAVAAIALGSAIIEKHITLDAKKIGMDNQIAMEPDALQQLVKKCRTIQLALGNSKREVLPEEYAQRLNMRRSIVAKRDIKKGQIIKQEDLDVKRPGYGIPPNEMESILGKTASNDIEEDTIITMDDINMKEE